MGDPESALSIQRFHDWNQVLPHPGFNTGTQHWQLSVLPYHERWRKYKQKLPKKTQASMQIQMPGACTDTNTFTNAITDTNANATANENENTNKKRNTKTTSANIFANASTPKWGEAPQLPLLLQG